MRIDNGLLVIAVAVFWASAGAAPKPLNEMILHAASYDGKITTLSLRSTKQGGYELKPIFPPATDGGPSPSWLVQKGNGLINIDEGINAQQGTITEYEEGPHGKLKLRASSKTQTGGLHGTLYAGGKALAVAH